MATDLKDLYPETGRKNDLTARASIEALKDHLLKTEVANYVVKIILFGSQAKGSATESSDVDVMVLTADGARTEKALILLKQDDLPGSRGGVVAVFGQLYVKAGIVNRELGRDLNVSLKLRNEARYRPDATLTAENATTVLDLADRLVGLTRDLLEQVPE